LQELRKANPERIRAVLVFIKNEGFRWSVVSDD